MKKGVKFIFGFVFIILLSVGFVSAGFFGDLWGKVTGDFTLDPDEVKLHDDSDPRAINPLIQDNIISWEMRQKYSTFFDSNGWSVTFNTDSPFSGTGDSELVSNIITRYGLEDFEIEEVRCFVNYRGDEIICGDTLKQTGEDFWNEQEFDCSEKGLVCLNSENTGNCLDYHIKIKVDETLFTKDLDIVEKDDGLGRNQFEGEEISYVLKDCDSVIFGDRSGTFYNFDLLGENPSLDYKISFDLTSGDDPIHFAPVSFGNVSYVVSGYYLIAIDSFGEELMRYASGELYGSSTGALGIFYQPIVEDGNLYVGTSSGRVFSFNLGESLDSFNLNWVSEKVGGSRPITLSIGGNNLVYGDSFGDIVILNKLNGELKNSYNLVGKYSNPVVYGSVIFLSGQSGTSKGTGVVALNMNTGEKIWETFFGGSRISPVFIEENVLYVGAAGGVHALRIIDGSLIWQKAGMHTSASDKSLEKYFGTVGSAPAVDEDNVYFTGSSGGIFALNKEDGSPLWYYLIEDIKRSISGDGDYLYLSSPAVSENHVSFFGGKSRENSTFYVFDKNNGDNVLTQVLEGVSSSVYYEDAPGRVCKVTKIVEKISPAPEGKKRLSVKNFAKKFNEWRRAWKARDESKEESVATEYKVLSSTGCETNSYVLKGDREKLRHCTVYKGFNLWITLTDLKVKLLSVSKDSASLNISGELMRLSKGEDYYLGGDGILIKEIGEDYIVFEVGDLESLGSQEIDPEIETITKSGNLYCKDTDGNSKNPYLVYGKVEFVKQGLTNKLIEDSQEDRCLDKNTLGESFCSGIFPGIKKYDCDQGCEDGACVEGEEVKSYCDENNYCIIYPGESVEVDSKEIGIEFISFNQVKLNVGGENTNLLGELESQLLGDGSKVAIESIVYQSFVEGISFVGFYYTPKEEEKEVVSCVRSSDPNYYQLILGGSTITYNNGTLGGLTDTCEGEKTKEYKCGADRKSFSEYIRDCATGKTCEGGVCVEGEVECTVKTMDEDCEEGYGCYNGECLKIEECRNFWGLAGYNSASVPWRGYAGTTRFYFEGGQTLAIRPTCEGGIFKAVKCFGGERTFFHYEEQCDERETCSTFSISEGQYNAFGILDGTSGICAEKINSISRPTDPKAELEIKGYLEVEYANGTALKLEDFCSPEDSVFAYQFEISPRSYVGYYGGGTNCVFSDYGRDAICVDGVCIEREEILKSCYSQNGFLCGGNEICTANQMESLDEGICCSESCTESERNCIGKSKEEVNFYERGSVYDLNGDHGDSCTDGGKTLIEVFCPESAESNASFLTENCDFGCSEGVCNTEEEFSKNCSNQGGNVCLNSQICQGEIYGDSWSRLCCGGDCVESNENCLGQKRTDIDVFEKSKIYVKGIGEKVDVCSSDGNSLNEFYCDLSSNLNYSSDLINCNYLCLEGECLNNEEFFTYCSQNQGYVCGENELCLTNTISSANGNLCCSESCTESERNCIGKSKEEVNFYERGSVYDLNGDHGDSCTDGGKTLIEVFCPESAESNASFLTENCGEGFVCKNGACVEEDSCEECIYDGDCYSRGKIDSKKYCDSFGDVKDRKPNGQSCGGQDSECSSGYCCGSTNKCVSFWYLLFNTGKC